MISLNSQLIADCQFESELIHLSVSSVSLHDVSDSILADTELACDPAIAAPLGPHRDHLRLCPLIA